MGWQMSGNGKDEMQRGPPPGPVYPRLCCTKRWKSGLAEDGGSGLQPSPDDPAVLCLGRRRETVHGLADQASEQGGGQNFLPRPAVVCPCSLRFPFGPPLPGGAGLGFIDRRPSQNLRTKGAVCSKFVKKTHLEGNLCYLAFSKANGLQEGGISAGSNPGWKVPKPFFDCGGQGCRIISWLL